MAGATSTREAKARAERSGAYVLGSRVAAGPGGWRLGRPPARDDVPTRGVDEAGGLAIVQGVARRERYGRGVVSAGVASARGWGGQGRTTSFSVDRGCWLGGRWHSPLGADTAGGLDICNTGAATARVLLGAFHVEHTRGCADGVGLRGTPHLARRA